MFLPVRRKYLDSAGFPPGPRGLMPSRVRVRVSKRGSPTRRKKKVMASWLDQMTPVSFAVCTENISTAKEKKVKANLRCFGKDQGIEPKERQKETKIEFSKKTRARAPPLPFFGTSTDKNIPRQSLSTRTALKPSLKRRIQFQIPPTESRISDHTTTCPRHLRSYSFLL